MTDVREYMDTLVSKKIPTGKKIKYTDPNGVEQEIDELKPISKFYSYVKDEREIYSRTLQEIENNRKFFCSIKKDVKLSDMLKELKYNASFVARDDIASFVEWAINVGKDIQYTCEHGDVNKNVDWKKLNLVFDSTQMGCGKSYFEMSLMRGARNLGIKVLEQDYETQLPKGGFENHLEESQNLLVVHQERRGQKVDLDTLKQIARREMYPYTEKGKMQIRIPGRAIMLGSTNGFDYTSQDPRGFRTIHCLPYTWQEISRISRKFPENSNQITSYITKIYRVNYEFSWISRFLDKLIDKKDLNINTNEIDSRTQKSMKLREYDMSYLLLDILESITNERELLYSISTSGLAKLYKRYSAKELTYNQCNAIATLLQQLFRVGLVRKCNYESRDLYVKYDLSGIMDIKVSDLSEQLDLTPEREIQDAFDEWDRIIKMAEDFENDPDNGGDKMLKDEVNDVDFPKNYLFKENEYAHPSVSRDETKQFIISNPVKKECIQQVIDGSLDPGLLARGEYLENNNFVFECDDVSIEEQKEMVENLPDDVKESIISVTSSGADSIHVLLKTNNDKQECRKAVWDYLSKKYFKGKPDEQCSNNSRLTPNPNAIRNRKADTKPQFVGKKQTCFYFNSNPKALDVNDIVQKELDRLEEQEEKYRVKRWQKNLGYDESSNYSRMAKKPLNVETLRTRKETAARNYAIALLEGNISHGGDAISGMKYLLATGYDEDDLRSEIPLMTWSVSEFEGMLKFAKKGVC